MERIGEILMPDRKMIRRETAKWVKSLGGKTLDERISEYESKRDDLILVLDNLGRRVRRLYPLSTDIYREMLIGNPYYSLATIEYSLSRRFPFLQKNVTELVSVTLGNIPRLDMDPNLLPANDFSAAIERGVTGYVQCTIHKREISGWVYNEMDRFVKRHGYPTERVFFKEKFENPADNN